MEYTLCISPVLDRSPFDFWQRQLLLLIFCLSKLASPLPFLFLEVLEGREVGRREVLMTVDSLRVESSLANVNAKTTLSVYSTVDNELNIL